jgi:hypothetical protein
MSRVAECFPYLLIYQLFLESAFFAEGDSGLTEYLPYTLGNLLENLWLSGSDPISGTGNASANQLDGSMNSAANVLTGGLEY